MLKGFVYSVLFAVAVYYFSEYMEGCTYDTNVNLNGKVVVVTGANSGIGKETVIDLAKKGAKVYMGCRSLEKSQKALDDIRSKTGVQKDKVVLLKLDLSSLESVRNFAKEYKKRESKLDILVNNAGVHPPSRLETVDGHETTFTTNHLGHFLLTGLLADLLVKSAPSRVVTVSSYAHSFSSGINFDDLMSEKSYNWWPAYTHSKLANIIFAKNLAKRLGGKGVTSVSLHPGTVKTEMSRSLPGFNIPYVYEVLHFISSAITKDAWHGARTSIYCALAPEVTKHNGAYFSECAVATPSHADATKDDVARKLWQVSIELVQLKNSETIPAFFNI